MTEATQKKIVVTGMNGFVGRHLVRDLASASHEVLGIGHKGKVDPNVKNLLSRYLLADLTEEWPVKEPTDCIIHLAGLAVVWESFDRPQDYINANSAMVTNMCEFYLKELKSDNPTPRIIIVSTGHVYDPSQPMPLTESAEYHYNSPYTISKVLVEHQAAYYRKRGLDVIVVRPFNHIGPEQTTGFLIPDIISQLATSNKVVVGNISTKRDYTDVRDIVRAYRLLAEAATLNYDTYNACTGVSYSGNEIIVQIKKILDKPTAIVETDQTKVRPTDTPDIFGDASRLRKDTGWTPEISLEQTLKDCVESF